MSAQENQDKDGWRSIRKKAISRDGGACRFCDISNEEHKDEYGCELSVHHIIPKAEGGNNELDNLIAVCRSCHKTIEDTQASALSQLTGESSPEVDLEIRREIYHAYKSCEWLWNRASPDDSDGGDNREFDNVAQGLQEAESIIKEAADEPPQSDTAPEADIAEMPVVGRHERGEVLLALAASEVRELVRGEVPPELADTVVNSLMRESGVMEVGDD